MPDADGIKDAKMFYCDMQQKTQDFSLKVRIPWIGDEKQAGTDI